MSLAQDCKVFFENFILEEQDRVYQHLSIEILHSISHIGFRSTFKRYESETINFFKKMFTLRYGNIGNIELKIREVIDFTYGDKEVEKKEALLDLLGISKPYEDYLDHKYNALRAQADDIQLLVYLIYEIKEDDFTLCQYGSYNIFEENDEIYLDDWVEDAQQIIELLIGKTDIKKALKMVIELGFIDYILDYSSRGNESYQGQKREIFEDYISTIENDFSKRFKTLKNREHIEKIINSLYSGDTINELVYLKDASFENPLSTREIEINLPTIPKIISFRNDSIILNPFLTSEFSEVIIERMNNDNEKYRGFVEIVLDELMGADEITSYGHNDFEYIENLVYTIEDRIMFCIAPFFTPLDLASILFDFEEYEIILCSLKQTNFQLRRVLGDKRILNMINEFAKSISLIHFRKKYDRIIPIMQIVNDFEPNDFIYNFIGELIQHKIVKKDIVIKKEAKKEFGELRILISGKTYKNSQKFQKLLFDLVQNQGIAPDKIAFCVQRESLDHNNISVFIIEGITVIRLSKNNFHKKLFDIASENKFLLISNFRYEIITEQESIDIDFLISNIIRWSYFKNEDRIEYQSNQEKLVNIK